MPITMNSINVNQNINFKGSYSRTDQGNQYYKTSAGTAAGAVLAVPAFALNVVKNPKGASKFTGSLYRSIGMEEELVQKMEELVEKEIANSNKFKLPTAITAAVCSLGCGMIVDHIRNKKAQEVADLTRQVGVKGAMMQGEGVAISQKGRTYYDSNVGSTYGALLGAGCGLIASGLGYMETKQSELLKELKKMGANTSNIGTYVMLTGLFALGGWLMGKLADHNTNKAAERKA